MASFDVTGGYNPALDFPLQTKPENPQMRDSASVWVSDNEGRFGFPRVCIEAVAGQWDYRGVEANFAFPDGRVLIGSNGYAPKGEPKVVNGKIVTINAGPLTFEVVEPFRKWVMTFDGPAYDSTVQRSMQGIRTGPSKNIKARVEMEMGAPPWVQAGQNSGGQSTVDALGAVGGHRHEQLFRCTGSFAVEGEAERTFNGTGLAIRRSGVRDVGVFPGHCWLSALFPSGRAFGFNAFPPREDDGTPSYADAYVVDGGKLIAAKLIEAPWMKKFVPHDGACNVVLETKEHGRIHIEGRTNESTYICAGNPMFGDWNWPKDAPPARTAGQPGGGLPFHQGGAKYTWDGESAYGMIERSYPNERTSI
ncbi:MAG: hypothetical protein ABW199_08405 [Caulobacterales bacterium]